MRLTTHYHHTRYEENGSEGKISLRMPRRKSSIFKPPGLIQFQVTADTHRYGTLLKNYDGVFGSLKQSVSSLSYHQRIHNILPGRSRHGAWTQNLSHDPPHACGTSDTPGVAAGHHHLGRACSPGSDYLTHSRWEVDFRRGRHGRDQPALCLQVGAAVSGGWGRGISR